MTRAREAAPQAGHGSIRPADPAPAAHAEPLFDAQRLDAYRVALEFQVLSATLLPRRGQSALRDQLDRASASIVLCIAEGAGRSSRPDKARFYSIARGSATECAAIVDIAMARRLCPAATGASARTLLVRIVQMLTKLIGRMGR